MMALRLYIIFSILILRQAESHGQPVDTAFLKKHFLRILSTPAPRNYLNIESLNLVADYLQQEFQKYSASVSVQEFSVQGKIYKNVICSFHTQQKRRIVVGAHYDVCGNQPGADDNASGVVGLLALARLLQHQQLSCRIDLVAYSLEEPPYFRSPAMGSFIHAQSLQDEHVDVEGMISLEMIGYFSNARHSQHYPLKILKWFYGSRGNYITLVRKLNGDKFDRKMKRLVKRYTTIKVKNFKGPSSLPGIDFSDHLNYWKLNYPAFMITDTSFYRNKNYHQPSDTLSTLSLSYMKEVIDGLYKALVHYAS